MQICIPGKRKRDGKNCGAVRLSRIFAAGYGCNTAWDFSIELSFASKDKGEEEILGSPAFMYHKGREQERAFLEFFSPDHRNVVSVLQLSVVNQHLPQDRGGMGI